MNEMTQSVMTKNLMIILEFSVFQITLNPSICSAGQSFIMDIDKEDEQIDTNFGMISVYLLIRSTVYSG